MSDSSWGKNVAICGADMSASMYGDNKDRYVLVLAEGLVRPRLRPTTLTAEARYSINFTQSGKKFALILHYNEEIVTYMLIQ